MTRTRKEKYELIRHQGLIIKNILYEIEKLENSIGLDNASETELDRITFLIGQLND